MAPAHDERMASRAMTPSSQIHLLYMASDYPVLYSSEYAVYEYRLRTGPAAPDPSPNRRHESQSETKGGEQEED